MPYATQADLETRFSAAEILQLSDRNGDDTPDSGIIDAALSDASQEIDGYLAVRYALPLSETPELLVRLCCDIARYRLWSDDATDQIRQRYEDATAALKRLADGSMQMVFTTPPEQPIAQGATPASRVAYFTDDALALMP